VRRAAGITKGARVFGYYVSDPDRYGVVELGPNMKALSIEEKPKAPRSNYAVTGVYFYDNRVVEIAAGLQPSARGELEITSVNQVYLESGELEVELLGRGHAWLDTGTHESLQDASTFVSIIQARQGLMIACPEEIAFHAGWIGADQMRAAAAPLKNSAYGKYLLRVVHEKDGAS
jgi:glucose-1-phosphate thymidylyltransferase